MLVFIQEAIMKKTKVCSYCGKRKKIERFAKGKKCISCKSVYDREKYLEKKDEVDARSKAYGKTERGRASNRRASKNYGERTNWKRAKVWYARLKTDPIAYEEFLHRHKAQNAVWYALKTGKLVRGKCEVCKSENVQAHHADYSKPLDVRWLCPLHHGVIRRS